VGGIEERGRGNICFPVEEGMEKPRVFQTFHLPATRKENTPYFGVFSF
jgi:hypothetical protein